MANKFMSNTDLFGGYAYIKTDFSQRVHQYKIVSSFESNGYCDVPIMYNSQISLHKEIVPVLNVIHCGVDETKVVRVAASDCEKIVYMGEEIKINEVQNGE